MTIAFQNTHAVPYMDVDFRTRLFDRRRFPELDFDAIASSARQAAKRHIGQHLGRVVSYKLSGVSNIKQTAAELLRAGKDTPPHDLQQRLIQQGHTITLDALDWLITCQNKGWNVGFGTFVVDESDYDNQPRHILFIEIASDSVVVAHVKRVNLRQWSAKLSKMCEAETDYDFDLDRHYLLTRDPS